MRGAPRVRYKHHADLFRLGNAFPTEDRPDGRQIADAWSGFAVAILAGGSRVDAGTKLPRFRIYSAPVAAKSIAHYVHLLDKSI